MMKKRHFIFLLAAAVPMIQSCLDNVVVEEADEARIDFSWYTNRPLSTRADDTYFVGGTGAAQERHLPVGTGFGVFGYFHPQNAGVAGSWNDNYSDNHPRLFYNEPVTVGMSGLDYTYSYTHSRYWPKNTLDRMSFIAYYPYNANINMDGTPNEDAIVEPFLDTRYDRKGMVGFYYTVPETASNAVDLMVSDLCMDQSYTLWDGDHTRGLTGNANGKVKFFFHHALSQVRIKSVNRGDIGSNEDVDLKINYIVFNNVAVFGQCIPVPDDAHPTATGRVATEPTWPAGSLSARRPNGFPGVTAHVCYDEDHDTWDTDQILLMIPHTFLPGATIEVNYDLKRKKGATGEYYSYPNNTLSAPLTTTAISGWAAGRIYNYNITLNLKSIEATAEVLPWLEAGEDIIMDN